ncbi:hypothetical protein MGU_08787 [Metarhizium guizhouense ARSEF 977]|uniref:Uncharacterized protein n=1 Tax=Metarhizium guizhouense (strain ARSEF 977) TaxID=1276136 RepID=A0A0B4H2Q9_METGA|nr:hypothetical protein MGU_08787 [Metarhizium guizhouense ARSEF 977]
MLEHQDRPPRLARLDEQHRAVDKRPSYRCHGCRDPLEWTLAALADAGTTQTAGLRPSWKGRTDADAPIAPRTYYYLDGIVHRPLSPPAGHGGGCRAHGDDLAFRGSAEFHCFSFGEPFKGGTRAAIIPTVRPPPPPPQGLESGLAAATLTRESYQVAMGVQTSRWHWI